MRSLALAGLAVLIFIAAATADEPKSQSADSAEASRSEDRSRRPDRPIAERYAQIRAEFEAEQAANNQRAALRSAGKGAIPREKRQTSETRPADSVTAYCRRMVELAESSPDDPGARDALLWVVSRRNRADIGEYGDQFARAAELLVRHFGDDPEAVRVGLTLDNWVTPRRDALLLGFYVKAKGREAKGLARLALGQYLSKKAKEVVYARSVEGRPKLRLLDGGKVLREDDLPDERYAYHLELLQCDPQIIRAEAVRLLEEVISEYGDVPHVTRRQRELQALLKEPAPKWNGRPLADEGRRTIEAQLARKQTLGQAAEARLDELFNLAVGKPAPDMQGVDLDGKPLKLRDFRGKAVMLVFWGSWCGPCMRLVPHERELAERYKDRPFTVLGVNCGDTREIARKTTETAKISWPNWYDGEQTGRIATLYHIRGFPSMFVLDAAGIIRSRGQGGPEFDALIDKLVKEVEAGSRSGARTMPPG